MLPLEAHRGRARGRRCFRVRPHLCRRLNRARSKTPKKQRIQEPQTERRKAEKRRTERGREGQTDRRTDRQTASAYPKVGTEGSWSSVDTGHDDGLDEPCPAPALASVVRTPPAVPITFSVGTRENALAGGSHPARAGVHVRGKSGPYCRFNLLVRATFHCTFLCDLPRLVTPARSSGTWKPC